MTLRSRRLANRQVRLKGRETEVCPGTTSTITDDAHRVRLLALTEWLRLVATALPIHSHDAPAPSSPATKQPVRRRSRTTRRASQREPHSAHHKTAANRRRRRPSDAKCGRNAPDDRGGGRSTPGRAVDAQQDQDATRRDATRTAAATNRAKLPLTLHFGVEANPTRIRRDLAVAMRRTGCAHAWRSAVAELACAALGRPAVLPIAQPAG
jgi:hypothetical protein